MKVRSRISCVCMHVRMHTHAGWGGALNDIYIRRTSFFCLPFKKKLLKIQIFRKTVWQLWATFETQLIHLVPTLGNAVSNWGHFILRSFLLLMVRKEKLFILLPFLLRILGFEATCKGNKQSIFSKFLAFASSL